MNKKNNRKGFTIVELVIVIAVIAILAAVLVPTFGNVITNAKISAAKQKAKNLYTSYVAATAETGSYVDDCYVLVGDYCVEIKDGGVVEGDPASEYPTDKCYNKLEEGKMTTVTVETGCVTADCFNKAAHKS